MQKKVLILGAGTYQIPLIIEAKKQGYYVIVCSIAGNYPGFELADKCYYVNTTDVDACVQIAKNEGVDAVCTTGTDVALPTLGAIVDQMNLIGPSYQSAILSSNKYEMKCALEKLNVRTARFRKVYTLKECIAATKELNGPWILKVVDSSGSRGIVVVHSTEDIECRFQELLDFTSLDYILIEEFIEGEEFGVQACVVNGELTLFMPHGDIVFKSDTGVPIGHYVPYNCPNQVNKEIWKQVIGAIKALGIDNAAVNADMILRDGKAYILEIGARAGATCLPELVSNYYDINYYKYILDLALGIPNLPKFNEPKNHVLGRLIISSESGILSSQETPVIKNDNFISYSVDYKIGDSVRKFKVGSDRIGQVIVKGKSLDEMNNLVDIIIKQMNIKVN